MRSLTVTAQRNMIHDAYSLSWQGTSAQERARVEVRNVRRKR